MAELNRMPKVRGYVMGDKIGSGTFADVYSAFKNGSSREIVAIKCVNKDKLSKTALNNFVSEIEILKKLDHKYIVKLIDFAWDETYIYLIMEHCSGGSLYSFVRRQQRLPEEICQRFLQQLASALKYLRNKDISHFDLKPQNILVLSKRLQIIKIADFGLAEHIKESDTCSLMRGSPLYMAPEIVLRKHYDARADIWSVGVIVYECLFGRAPYSSTTVEELLAKIKSEKAIKIPSNASISSDCSSFLTGCLERDLDKRFDFDSFFNHPFVDLNHEPSPESIEKASHILNEAVHLDDSKHYQEAFNSYNDALKFLVPVMYVEKNAFKRSQLKSKIAGYVKRMEWIKEQINGPPKMIKIPNFINEGTLSRMDYKENLIELLQLTKTTPNMRSPIEIAQSAELYSREENYSLALEKYELALGELMPLLQVEPKGRRKDLLKEEMNRWMSQAENMKQLLVNDKGEEIVEEVLLDSEKTCCVS